MTASVTTPTITGSKDNVVKWVFDDGTVWSQAGTFRLTLTGGSSWLIMPGHFFDATVDRRLEYKPDFSPSVDLNGFLELRGGSKVRGFIFSRGSSLAYNRETRVRCAADRDKSGTMTIFDNCLFRNTTPDSGGSTPATGGMITGYTSGQGNALFIDCVFQLNNNKSDDYIFHQDFSRGWYINVIGGRVTNSLPNHNIIASGYVGSGTSGSYSYYFKNFDIGNINIDNLQPGDEDYYFEIRMENINNMYDFYFLNPQGSARWDSSGNYPTNMAMLPDGTSWSIRVYPNPNICRDSNPFQITVSDKIYQSSAAQRTISLELLIKDTSAFSNPQKDEWWMDVLYVKDTDGSYTRETTYGSGSLDTSTANWSTTTYGSNSYNKYKLSLNTQYAIKQYSNITVVLFSNKPAINPINASNADIYFVDPDFTIT